MKNRYCMAILAAAFVIAFHTVQADSLTMLTDFGLPKSSDPIHLVDVNGTLFFFVPTDSGYRSQLWRSDGTAAGTVLIKKELPLAAWITILVANVNGTLFFGGYVAGGLELWKSDGTEAGTLRVKEFPWPWSFSDFLAVNETLAFVVRADVSGTQGMELWKSDGTATGTTLVVTIQLHCSHERSV